MSKKAFLVLSSYLTIYIVWGSTYFFIKMAVETIPPLYVIGFRWLVGGILILGFSLLTRRIKRLPTLREVGNAALLGVLLLLIGNGLISMGERKVDSYITALVLALTPIVVAFFDWMIFQKKLSLMNLVGILVGLGGVALLLYDGKSIVTSFTLDLLIVICGLLSWSFATSLGHKVDVYPDNLVNSGIQMLIIGIVCLLLMIWNRPSFAELMPQFSNSSWVGAWYLAIIGSLAFCAYTYLIANEPAIRISSYAFINPLIATFLGLVVGKETPAPFLGYAFPIILTGLFLMIYGEALIGYLKTILGRAGSKAGSSK